MVSNRCLRDTFIFCSCRWLKLTSFSAMARLSSANEKKRWFLNAASIQRSTISTALSTLALSLGLPGLAGITVVP